MNRIKIIIWGLASLVIGINTVQGEEETTGFRFPGGEVVAGSETFVKLNCVLCHSVKGVHFEKPKNSDFDHVLAAEIRFVKNYEDLVKAISNPRHVVKERYKVLMSKAELEALAPLMKDFTNEMTVRQLMDLTTFLDKAYSNAVEGYGKK